MYTITFKGSLQNCQISNIFLEVLKTVCLNCLEETDIGKILTWFDWASDWGLNPPQSETSGYATPWIGGPYILDIKYFTIITITSFVVLNFSNKNIIHVARTGIELCLKHDFKPNYSAPIDDQNPQHYVGKILTWSLFFFFFFFFFKVRRHRLTYYFLTVSFFFFLSDNLLLLPHSWSDFGQTWSVACIGGWLQKSYTDRGSGSPGTSGVKNIKQCSMTTKLDQANHWCKLNMMMTFIEVKRSSEVKCGKLCSMATKLDQKNIWCKLMMMVTFMEVKGHQRSNGVSYGLWLPYLVKRITDASLKWWWPSCRSKVIWGQI